MNRGNQKFKEIVSKYNTFCLSEKVALIAKLMNLFLTDIQVDNSWENKEKSKESDYTIGSMEEGPQKTEDKTIQPAETSDSNSFEFNELLKDIRGKDLKNAKNTLQEYCHSIYFPLPKYRMIDKKGPGNCPTFTVEVCLKAILDGQEQIIKETGKDGRKKGAGLKAAKKACNKIGLEYL